MVVICNGGKEISNIKEGWHNYTNIHILKISNGDLLIAKMENLSMGLRLILQGKSSPVFICLYRNKSLSIMNNSRSMCMTMHLCARTQPQSLSRGKHKHVFTEDNNTYYCVCAQPGRAEKGVQ
jgi:hypothetical protein